MTEWFDQRYISREDHLRIVDYYRKQVAWLYHDLRELRERLDIPTAGAGRDGPGLGRELCKPRQPFACDNVIHVDFHRPR